MYTLRCKKCVIKEPSLIPWAHLPLTTPLLLLPIPQAHNYNAASSIIAPESSFEASHKVKTN